ncbi:MAG: hypothetical protein COY58_05485 [Gammaproteobacteria bacterium CG_4_10_14_0_8_um_filter_38_16]|nr:MAG: hypothetical protein COY58_05485 [Gammaproteobacteria bacterium CG_4_10_14_0_8_um_filter_38_16]PJA04343.1 MAG: hypothetical protein COX72_00095 [Gammaproteobacteria bacterium CG_4_10_14_0_2_um_filter_38_22]PJB09532.1 MAG: hypothetical protein CO120_09485 [Gammaproteobacteria bacterium CG_4_9_14_3_um_filter_38_9]
MSRFNFQISQNTFGSERNLLEQTARNSDIESHDSAKKRMSQLEVDYFQVNHTALHPEKKCLGYAIPFLKVLLLLGASGAFTWGACFMGKKATEHKNMHGYIEAAVLLAIAAFGLMASAMVFACSPSRSVARRPSQFGSPLILNDDANNYGACADRKMAF